MVLGEMLRAYRIHNELTSRQIAKEIGIRVQAYRRIEEGTIPRQNTLQLIVNWATKPDIDIPQQQPISQKNNVEAA